MSDLEEQNLVDVKRKISAAAKRALSEAQDRKRAVELEQANSTNTAMPAKEINGRGGLDPVRYGDWEKKGLAVDF